MGQSWSEIRKYLEEDLLCEKLRGRVQYFFTIYHKAPDRYGRFAIQIDGVEVFWANPYNERYYYENEYKIKSAQNIPMREWNGKVFVNDKENRIAEEMAALQAIEAGKADSHDVLRAVLEYLGQTVEKSLWSDNLLLRMFAVLDRRAGKRTLVKLEDTYEYLPDWLKQFYELRFAVEGIFVKNRAKLLLSADGEIGYYDVDDAVIEHFDELLESFPHGHNYTEQDFVAHIKKKQGERAIRFVKAVGCYPVVDPVYKNVKWYNF